MAPPFVACRICRSVEGKLKNYTDNKFLIRAYEEFSGCPFVEWPYMTKFCPECACLIRKVYKFRRKCKKSYRFVMEHLQCGRKITKPFIQHSGTSLYHKPTDLSTWNSFRIPTVDFVHNPKAYKSKKKNMEEPVFYIKHLTVPKDTEAEIPTVVPEPIYDFNERYYDSSDLEEYFNPRPKNKKKSETVVTDQRSRDTNTSMFERPVLEAPVFGQPVLEAPVFERSVLEAPVFERSVLEAPVFGQPVLEAPQVFERPVLEAPVFEQPVFGQPVLEAPRVFERSVLEPVFETSLQPEGFEPPMEPEGVVVPKTQSDLIQRPENEDEVDIKIEEDMMDDASDNIEATDHTDSVEMVELKPEDPDTDKTLQEIKAEMLGAMVRGDVGKGQKRKRSEKKEKESRVSKNSQQLQKRAKRNQSNQELEEHFTVTQFHTEEEQVQEFLKRRQGEGYLEGKFKCELCLKSFKEQKWMDAHTQKHEPSAGSFICTICKIHSRTPKLYRTHRDSNHTTRYACRRCPFLTYSKAQALKHHGWHEGVEHTCQHCGATFRKHTTYMGHLRRAHPSAHICGACARCFVSNYGLNLHIKAVHKDINKLENDSTRCEECDVMFVSRQMYVRHLLITDRHKEMSKDILGCRKCGEQFETTEEMEKHTHYKERKYVRKDVPRRTIKCDECSEVFSHPNGVYQHYLREHPDTPYRFAVRRHYLCEQCGKTFKSPGLLQQHGLSHLGLRPAPAKKPPGRNSCRLCGKTYSKLSGLFRHKLTHLGVRRHKCHICEKAFTDTSNLKQHVQGVHLNIRRIRKR